VHLRYEYVQKKEVINTDSESTGSVVQGPLWQEFSLKWYPGPGEKSKKLC
jgi:hypothetical protein